MTSLRLVLLLAGIGLLAFVLGLLARGAFTPPAPPAVAHDEHAGHDPGVLTITPHDVAMAEVGTATVERRALARSLRAVGTVGYNETGLTTVPSRVQGYVEKLFVSSVGLPVKAGDHLAEIYSPDLIMAQQELLSGRDPTAGNLIANAARLKLRRYGISDEVIEQIASSGKAQERLVITAPRAGTVVEKMVDAYAPVMMGMPLYKIADLSSIWIHLAIHEQDLALVRPGQTVTVTSDTWPGEHFNGRVTLVEPSLDPETRTARARVVLVDEQQRLRPGMYVLGEIAVPLAVDGTPGPTGVEGRWTCAMHPDVLTDAAGACPVCAMALEQIPVLKPLADARQPLAIPAQAVLSLGNRDLVYLVVEPGRYRPVAVELGARADDWWLVRRGLEEGQQIVTRGAFLLDSEAQIRGLPSLLAPTGGGAATGHENHGGGGSKAPARTKAPVAPIAPTGHEQHGDAPPVPAAPRAPVAPAPAAPAQHKH
jgi:membrane fusion protein, copper/silver efflux system